MDNLIKLCKIICPDPIHNQATLRKTTSMEYLHTSLPKWPLGWKPPNHLRVPWFEYHA